MSSVNTFFLSQPRKGFRSCVDAQLCQGLLEKICFLAGLGCVLCGLLSDVDYG